MKGAEFQCRREFLGLSLEWTAKLLRRRVKTVARWEADYGSVPPGAAAEMERLCDEAARLVGKLSIELSQQHRAIRTASDSQTGLPFPPSWYRMISARVQERTGLPIRWQGNDMTLKAGK